MRKPFVLAVALSSFSLALGTEELLAQTNPEPDQNPTSNMGALKAQVETAGSYSAHSGNSTRAILDLTCLERWAITGSICPVLECLRNDRIEANTTWEPDQRTDFGSAGWSHSWAWVAYYAEESQVVGDNEEEIYITSITITFPDGHASKYKITRSNRRHPPDTGWDPDPRCGPPYYAHHGGKYTGWVPRRRGDHLENMTQDGLEFLALPRRWRFASVSGRQWRHIATEVYDARLKTLLRYDALENLQEVGQDGGRKLTFVG